MDTSRTVYKIDQQHPGSEIAAETAAALAAASLVFWKSDPLYSRKLIRTARRVNTIILNFKLRLYAFNTNAYLF